MPPMPPSSANNAASSFAQDIRPLFRESDRDSMSFALDQWDYNDVRAHAESILQRLADGTMPCDGEWPDEQITRFRSWFEAGMPA